MLILFINRSLDVFNILIFITLIFYYIVLWNILVLNILYPNIILDINFLNEIFFYILYT